MGTANNRFAVVLNGTLGSDRFLKENLHNYRFLISADGAVDRLYQIGMKPDLLLGDMDSVEKQSYAWIKQQNVERKTFPVEKDATDSFLAVEEAIARGADAIDIYFPFGSRWDHSLTNIGLLLKCREANVFGRMLDDNNELFLLEPGRHIIMRRERRYLSLLATMGPIESIYLTGTKYPLYNETLEVYSSRGISNEFIDDAKLSFEGHPLLLFLSNMEEGDRVCKNG